jgi:hypothetical protein
MNVELRVETQNDLVDASAFFDGQRDGLGDYFIDCLFSDLEKLETEAGIHEVAYGLHRKLSERFPFAIYYLVADPVVDACLRTSTKKAPVTRCRSVCERTFAPSGR